MLMVQVGVPGGDGCPGAEALAARGAGLRPPLRGGELSGGVQRGAGGGAGPPPAGGAVGVGDELRGV
eukprot:1180180-Prorocentrum_minimum.AAC.1